MPKTVTDVFCVLKRFVAKSGLTDNSPERVPPRIAKACGLGGRAAVGTGLAKGGSLGEQSLDRNLLPGSAWF